MPSTCKLSLCVTNENARFTCKYSVYQPSKCLECLCIENLFSNVVPICKTTQAKFKSSYFTVILAVSSPLPDLP